MKKTDSVSSLVIGCNGQIGSAIAKILECDGIDINDIAPHKSYKFLHICIPYSGKFIKIVEDYKLLYSPDYTIIHSTVPIGTSRKCDAVHSPIRGVHPRLEEGIRTFVKYFGGQDARFCSMPFTEKGIEVKHSFNQEDTEALKLWDTTIYGLNILIEKEIHDFCKKNNVDFNLVYTDANRTYNRGYFQLGHPEFSKYVLKHMEGEIGGHCIKENAFLLDSPLANLLCKNTKN